jgi:hypothetical protein
MDFRGFKIRTQKKNKFVVDGYISYQITTRNNNIICPCENHKNTQNPKYTNDIYFCKHILFFLEKSGVDLSLLKFWKKINKIIIPDISQGKYIDSSAMWKIVDEQILNGDCGFCLEKLYSHNDDNDINTIYICGLCQGVVHTKCFKEWNTKSDYCMLCRGKT